MTPTLSSLPLELVEMVLEQAYLMERHSFFRYALVCSRWTNCSLKLLYERLDISCQDDAKRMAESSGMGLYGTETINLGCGTFVESLEWSEDIATVLRACSSTLRTLAFWFSVEKVPATLFYDIPFPCLRNLGMAGGFADPDATLFPTETLPLILNTLHISSQRSAGTQFALQSIVTRTLRGRATEKIQLIVFNPAYFEELRPLAPHVDTFVFCGCDECPLSELIPICSSPSVENLSLHYFSITEIQLILQNSSSNLKCLEVRMPTDYFIECIALLTKTLVGPTFVNLKQLRIIRMKRDELEGLEGGVEMARQLGKKGTAVIAVDGDGGFLS